MPQAVMPREFTVVGFPHRAPATTIQRTPVKSIALALIISPRFGKVKDRLHSRELLIES